MFTTFLRRQFLPWLTVFLMGFGAVPLLAGPSKVVVALNLTSATLAPGAMQSFTATVTGTATTTVNWTCTGGSIAGTGNTVSYTAPTLSNTYTVTATSTVDSTKKATATVTVMAPVPFPSLKISPASAVVNVGSQVSFSAAVTGLSNTSVVWRMVSGNGHVSQSGVYSAPSSASYNATVREQLEVICKADPSVTARVEATVQQVPPPGAVTISIPQPQRVEFVEGESAAFTALVTGVTDTRVEWEQRTGFGGYTNGDGIVSVLGNFNALPPSLYESNWGSDGSYFVLLRASSVADRSKFAFLLVRVWRRGTVLVSPGSYYPSFYVKDPQVQPILASSTLQLAVDVKGGGTVLWSIPSGGGSISNGGLFTAPSAPLQSRSVVVRATNSSAPSNFREVTIPLTEPGDVVISSSAGGVLPGGTLPFTATTLGTRDGVKWSVLAADGVSSPGTITRQGVYTAPASLGSAEPFRLVFVRATNASTAYTPAKYAEKCIRVQGLPRQGVLGAVTSAWVDSYCLATYCATGIVTEGYSSDSTDLSTFWTISGSGTIVDAWFDGTHGYPCVKFKTNGPGTATITAHPYNDAGSITVSKDIQVVSPPELSGVYSNGTNDLRVLDFGVKTVARPDGQTATMHRLWTKPGGRWVGRKLLGSGVACIYAGYSSWSDASANANFATDGMSLTTDPTYRRTSEVIIGAEPANAVVDGSTGLGPSIVYLRMGQSVQLQSAVGGTSDKAVIWSCSSGQGTVSSTGLYTAPPVMGTYKVTATSHADITKNYELTIRVGAADNIPADQVKGTFTGTVTNANDGSTVQGTLDLFADAGVVYAKVADPATPLFHSTGMGGIRGCSFWGPSLRVVFDPKPDGTCLPTAEYYYSWITSSGSGSRTMYFSGATQTSAVSVEITPNIFTSDLTLTTGSTKTFKALVLGSSNTGVTWSLPGYSSFLSVGGDTVMVTGPQVTGPSADYMNMHLQATSLADMTKTVSLNLTVKPGPQAVITPASAVASAGYLYGDYQFKASFPTQPSNDAFWNIEEGLVGGSITGDGYYRPGTILGTFHIVATSQWDPTLKANATVTVVEYAPYVSSFSVSPSTVPASQPVTVSWSGAWALNTPNPKLTLTLQDVMTGTTVSVDVTGQMSFVHAPIHDTRYTLSITGLSGKTGTATGYVSVQSIAKIQSISANPAFIRAGDPVTLIGIFTSATATLYYLDLNGWFKVYGPMTSGIPVAIPATHTAVANRQPQFFLKCTDIYGNFIQSASFTVPCAPALVQFTANPQGILAGSGGSSTLSWGINSAGLPATVTLTGRTQSGVETSYSTGGNTSKVLTPAETTTYTLNVSTNAGGESKILMVRVGEVAGVGISPAQTSLAAGGTKAFTASIIAVPGKEGVTWSASSGTIQGVGSTVSYTAPLTLGSATITATSMVDPNVSATATVTIIKPTVTLSITPATTTIPARGTMQFGYTITSDGDKRVAWAVQEGAVGGTIDTSGNYTAPGVPGTYHVVASSVADPTITSVSTVTVQYPDVQIAVTPSSVNLKQGDTYQFGFSSSNGPVTWTASGGQISNAGFYIAPDTPGVYTVTAASIYNPTKTANSTVTVGLADNPSIEITPGRVSIFPEAQKTFSAKALGLSNTAVTWSVTGSGGGSITSAGVYTAPPTTGTFVIVATSVQNSAVVGKATVAVGNVVVSPDDVVLAPGLTKSFTAALASGLTGPVVWSVDEGEAGGTISTEGLYTAPPANGIFHVRAAEPGGSSDVVSVKVGLIDAIILSPEIQVLEPGSYLIQAKLASGVNGNSIIAKKRTLLEPGVVSVDLSFEASAIRAGIGADGPYQISEVSIEKESDDPIGIGDTKIDLGDTQPTLLDAFQRPWVEFTGQFNTVGIDLNSNGLIDQLMVQVGVKVLEAGNYELTGVLQTATGEEVAMCPVRMQALQPGQGNLVLAFDGKTIRNAGKPGPYQVVDVAIWGQRKGANELAGTTAAYRIEDFEDPGLLSQTSKNKASREQTQRSYSTNRKKPRMVVMRQPKTTRKEQP